MIQIIQKPNAKIIRSLNCVINDVQIFNRKSSIHNLNLTYVLCFKQHNPNIFSSLLLEHRYCDGAANACEDWRFVCTYWDKDNTRTSADRRTRTWHAFANYASTSSFYRNAHTEVSGIQHSQSAAAAFAAAAVDELCHC